MGNRSSTHTHAPQWAPAPYPGPYREVKRGPPGAYSEPYIPHPHRSMMSLHETGPHMDERMHGMRGSRMSLNQIGIERVVPIPDAKTLKKLEKMERKHQKLVKKLNGGFVPSNVFGYTLPGPPPPQYQYPPPAQLYNRTLSMDDLQRAQLDMAELRLREEWRRRHPHSRPGTTTNKSTMSNQSTILRGGSVSSSSPVTSSSEDRTTENWNESRDGGACSRRSCEPLSTSTPMKTPDHGNAKTIEVKVERLQRTERTETSENKRSGGSQTYAQPILRGQPGYGSRSSVGGASQFRGDQSEIDFSWVSEEEEKIRNEKDRLPECYFGMEAPVVERKETKRKEEQIIGKENRSSVALATNLFEEEARRKRREREQRTSSAFHLNEPRPDYERNGPAERRLHRIQREHESRLYDAPCERQRWRSSMAF